MKASQVRAILAYFESFFTRKTIKGFAERVRSFDELPPALQAALRPHLDSAGTPELILQAPAQSVLEEGVPRQRWWPKQFLPWQITPDQALLLTPTCLLIASSAHPLPAVSTSPAPALTSPGQPQVTAIPLADILLLELGTVLLSAWLELAWARAGCLERRRVHFNAVGAPLFEDLCRRMRTLRTPAAASTRPLERACLEDLPYKFKTLIPRRLLLAEEPVRALVFRPALWSRGPAFFRRLAQPRLVALRTPAWLVLAEEDRSPDGTTYGLIARFLPLDCLRRAALQESPGELALALTLSRAGVEQELRLPFAVSERQKLAELLDFPLPHAQP